MKKAAPIAVVVLVILLFWGAVAYNFTLEDIRRISGQTADLSANHSVAVFFAITGAQAVGMILSLPTKALITLLSGALLGSLFGGIATFLGVLSGTTVLFFTARYFLRDWFIRKLGTRFEPIEARLGRHPIRAMIGLRLFITLPFGPITLAAALSSVRYRDFLVGTLIGDLPVIAAYSIAGRQLFALTELSQAVSPWTAFALIAAGIFFIGSAFLGRSRQHMAEKRLPR